MSFPDLMVAAGTAKSKGEARRLVQGGGLYLNNVRVADAEQKVTMSDALHGKFMVLRKGGKSYFLVKVR